LIIIAGDIFQDFFVTQVLINREIFVIRRNALAFTKNQGYDTFNENLGADILTAAGAAAAELGTTT
jgi:hypothetical protein